MIELPEIPLITKPGARIVNYPVEAVSLIGSVPAEPGAKVSPCLPPYLIIFPPHCTAPATWHSDSAKVGENNHFRNTFLSRFDLILDVGQGKLRGGCQFRAGELSNMENKQTINKHSEIVKDSCVDKSHQELVKKNEKLADAVTR